VPILHRLTFGLHLLGNLEYPVVTLVVAVIVCLGEPIAGPEHCLLHAVFQGRPLLTLHVLILVDWGPGIIIDGSVVDVSVGVVLEGLVQVVQVGQLLLSLNRDLQVLAGDRVIDVDRHLANLDQFLVICDQLVVAQLVLIGAHWPFQVHLQRHRNPRRIQH